MAQRRGDLTRYRTRRNFGRTPEPRSILSGRTVEELATEAAGG